MRQILMTVTDQEHEDHKREAKLKGISVSNLLRIARGLEPMRVYRFTPETASKAGIRSAEKNSKARG